jgi:hypothetical protein
VVARAAVAIEMDAPAQTAATRRRATIDMFVSPILARDELRAPTLQKVTKYVYSKQQINAIKKRKPEVRNLTLSPSKTFIVTWASGSCLTLLDKKSPSLPTFSASRTG